MKPGHLIFPVVLACVTALSLGISMTIGRLHAAQATRAGLQGVAWVPYQITYRTFNKKAE